MEKEHKSQARERLDLVALMRHSLCVPGAAHGGRYSCPVGFSSDLQLSGDSYLVGVWPPGLEVKGKGSRGTGEEKLSYFEVLWRFVSICIPFKPLFPKELVRYGLSIDEDTEIHGFWLYVKYLFTYINLHTQVTKQDIYYPNS